MGLFLKHSRSRGASRLVGVVIGDCCEDDGTGAWPAIRKIAARAGVSERTAQRSVTDLQQLGELTVAENGGLGRSNSYTIRIDRLLANPCVDPPRASKRRSDKSTGVTELHPVRKGGGGCQDERAEGDRIDAEGDKAVAPDPSSGSVLSDPSMDPSMGEAVASGSKYSDDFESFWATYPHKSGKVPAFKTWKKMSSAEKASAVADVPLRLAANWAGKELSKIPYGSTYLHKRQWEDELQQVNQIAAPAPPRLPKGMEQLRKAYQEAARREGNGIDLSADEGQGELVPTTYRRVDQGGVV